VFLVVGFRVCEAVGWFRVHSLGFREKGSGFGCWGFGEGVNLLDSLLTFGQLQTRILVLRLDLARLPEKPLCLLPRRKARLCVARNVGAAARVAWMGAKDNGEVGARA
jgi:hypothetical protein